MGVPGVPERGSDLPGIPHFHLQSPWRLPNCHPPYPARRIGPHTCYSQTSPADVMQILFSLISCFPMRQPKLLLKMFSENRFLKTKMALPERKRKNAQLACLLRKLTEL